MKHIIGIYGTLRLGGMHYQDYLGRFKPRFIAKTIIKGYDMCSIGGSYPALIKNDAGLGSILELYEVSNACFKCIDASETDANYTKVTDIVIVGGVKIAFDMWIFKMPYNQQYYNLTLMKTQDWLEFFRDSRGY